jgi:hypothetical protein
MAPKDDCGATAGCRCRLCKVNSKDISGADAMEALDTYRGLVSADQLTRVYIQSQIKISITFNE